MIQPIRSPKRPKPSAPAPTRTETRPGRVGLHVIFRDNIATIQALLASVVGHFDEYIFTDTGSKDGTRQVIQSFLRHQPGKVTDFAWIDDFAAARQACFEAGSMPWRMFLDSDDVLKAGDRVRLLTTKLSHEHPLIRGVYVPYDYDVDEALGTMRLVKWSAQWKWVDAIHERLEWSEPNGPGLGREHFAKTSEITVQHKRKTPQEKQQAIARNARIAERIYPTATGQYRARLARTIAMELKLQGRSDDAIPYLEELYAGYPNFAEGRQAAADIAKAHIVAKRLDLALEWGKKAGPSYEALAHHSREEWEQVVERQTRGQVVPQQTTHEGFIFEKCVAPVCAADAAERIGFKPSAVEQCLNTVRADLRDNTMVASLTARIRASIDRITVVVPGTPQPFDTNSGGAMLGGSEEAVVYLTRALANRGRNVRVFSPLPATTLPGLDVHGVDWQDISAFRPTDEHGHLVIWRSAGFALDLLQRLDNIDRDLKAGKEGVVPLTGLTGSSFWLHDRAMGVPPELGFKLCKAFDTVIVLSEHHRQCILRELGGQDPGNLVVLSNGIVAEQFEGLASNAARDPNRVVYSSCPSRGLRVLLAAWPRIKAQCPDAYLDIYYDWSMLRDMQPELYAEIDAAYQAVRHLNVQHHGGVGHQELNVALSGANVWAYSHFENTDVETFCISSVKAQAAGATVVTSDRGALPEVTLNGDCCSTPEEWEHEVIVSLLNPAETRAREENAEQAIDRFSWAKVAERFSNVWTLRRSVGPTLDVEVPASML